MSAMLVNLTPHVINIRPVVGEPMDLPPSGVLARNEVVELQRWNLDGVLVTDTMSGPTTGLPPERPGTWHVVSRAAADAAPHRRDLLVPHGLVRDQDGRIVGCAGLARIVR